MVHVPRRLYRTRDPHDPSCPHYDTQKSQKFVLLLFCFTFGPIVDSSDTCITTSTRKELGGERLGSHGRSGHGKGGDRGSGVSGVGGGGSDGKPTRVRTVLNEKQLHTLRTCYAANPRPDALMKEQLVEMTGLSPRVIRVWFQNKRCKDKKKAILMKQIQQQEKVGLPCTSYYHHQVSNEL